MDFLRTKDGKEIDFLVCIENETRLALEVKMSDPSLTSGFNYFAKFLSANVSKIQLVKELTREKTYPDGTEVRALVPWLANLNLKEC